jgi:thiamine phosphate synthase YjbQ (UPF0047 family)
MNTKQTTTKTEASVRNGIKIITRAIRKNESLSEAARQSGFGRNYVSDIKARIETNFENKNVTRDTYREFNKLIKEYNR